MSDLPFGIDISRYQYSSGWQQSRTDIINESATSLQYVLASLGGYIDRRFSYSWNA